MEYRFSGEALFPACLHDVKAAVRWLRQFGERVGVNGEAIGVWGESAGGHLAAFIALNSNDERLEGTVGVTGCSSDVVAGVAWYPDADILALGPDRTGSPDPRSPEALLIGGPTRDRREEAAFASPVSHVHPGAAPILLVHGQQDDLLPPQQSALMHEALQAVGATYELEWIEGAGHGFFGVDPDPPHCGSIRRLPRSSSHLDPAGRPTGQQLDRIRGQGDLGTRQHGTHRIQPLLDHRQDNQCQSRPPE